MAADSAHFESLDNLYRYTLICPSPTTESPSLRLTRGELISSVHKLIRRARTAELCFLVRAFFQAVQSALETVSNSPSLKGSISNFMNRIALSLIEEGVMIHSPADVQDFVCGELIQAGYYHSHTDPRHRDYAKVSHHIEDALVMTRNVSRGRLGSVVMSYAAHIDRRVPPDDPRERGLLAALHPSQVQQNAKPANIAMHVYKTMPMLYRVTQQAPYNSCAEFLRQCAMNAPIAPFVCDEHKILVDSQPLADPFPPSSSFPTRELLHEIGALEDMHTKGKRNRDAWNEFLTKGIKVENQTSVRLFNASYAELEELYNEGKMNELDSGKWDVKKAEPPKKAQKGAAAAPVASSRPGKSADGPRFESEEALLELTDESKLLGFKNGTVVGVLRAAFGPFAAGDSVFFKMGECYEDCAFAVECAKWQEAMGLPFVQTQIVWVKPALEWWARIPVDPNNKGDWGAALHKSLGSRIRRERDFFGFVPCLVASRFCGMRVSDRTRGSGDDSQFGLSLLKNLLFAKYVGIKDVGPFNMLVSNEQQVLIIDVGKPSTEQLEVYKTKGLFTSHKFGSAQLTPATIAASQNRGEISEFVFKLRTQVGIPVCASVGDRAFWDGVNAYTMGGEQGVAFPF